MIVEASIFGGEDRVLQRLADLALVENARTLPVARAHLTKERARRVFDAHRRRRNLQKLARKRRERGGDDQGDDGPDHGADDQPRDARPRQANRGDHFFATTSNVVASVRPETSGEYMHSTRVGGVTNDPSAVARVR